jgi:hypothetical protein
MFSAFSTSTLQSRLLSYLLKRYLGPYLQSEPSLSQLDYNLSQGFLQLKNLALNIDALNDGLSTRGKTFHIVRGWIDEITIHVPWKDLLKGEFSIVAGGVRIDVEASADSAEEDIAEDDEYLDETSTHIHLYTDVE